MKPRALLLVCRLFFVLFLVLLLEPKLGAGAPKCRFGVDLKTLAREAPVVLDATVVAQSRNSAKLQVRKTFRGQQDVQKLVHRPAREQPNNNKAMLLLRLEECADRANLQKGARYLVFARPNRRSLVALAPPQLFTKQVFRTVIKIVGRNGRVPTIKGLSTTTVEEKTPLKLQCKLTGSKVPKVEWFKDGKLLLLSNKRVKIKRRRLNVKSVTVEDEGVYECRGTTNETKNLSHTTRVIVLRKEPPSYVSKPCKSAMDIAYCMNGGTCLIQELLSIVYCECAEGYKGPRCENKAVSDMTNIHGDSTTRELSTYWGK